ncbi:allantoicase [Hydrocarboniclastica marina]|uniref:Probable allantoicase n=1 Tax=Hydrocarboniclastica marina TaxID=2259620 RepID=A0A4P7XLM2_9ALTE|nr:allantoicase [Hydrocarboniclastica marina]MAM00147.1 allantoicase [Alteromonadaceae bacterium]QCF27454.1 allantoicase [Hydrocarboniclastica marina]|tara:strand:- start:140 stop:1165 length:1026 start_codon:yes stop_codon:yes gene_type:complete
MSSDATIAAVVEGPGFTREGLNLADGSLGAAVVEVTDEFFAPRERMLAPGQPVFYPDRFDEHGKWMDGWETRRRRTTGHDWCIIRLAMPGLLMGVDFDTSFFTGNYPPAVALDACFSPENDPDEASAWQPLIPAIELKGNDHRFCGINSDQPWTHLRLHLYPDGGLARLRVYGKPFCDWSKLSADETVNLLALEQGGDQVAWSDAHYGEPRKLLRPGRGVNMGDGWETRRRREPGNDWCILALGHKGIAQRIEVDTAHFKGNFPAACSIQGASVEPGAGTAQSLVTQSMFWPTLMADQPLTADSIHQFSELIELGPITHIRFNILPDGGVSRLRLFGRPAQ